MGAEIHAGPAVNALDGHLLLAQGNGSYQTGLLAAAAAGAEILAKYHLSVRLFLQSPGVTSPGAGSIAAGPADHHQIVPLYSSLGPDLDGAVLEGDGAAPDAAAGEHAAQAANAALGMGDLQATAHFGPGCKG